MTGGRDTDTIAAIATAAGRGGIGIVRLSGPNAHAIAAHITHQSLPLTPRYAQFARFYDASGQVIDEGVLLPFAQPHSFTGEDVVELQGHGGAVVLQQVLAACCAAGARWARPGEFSERAFLNDKLDLVQAEAIADLIEAGTEQAARAAVRSLQGVFSQRIESLLEALIEVRLYLEATIDFPEEDIDFLADGQLLARLQQTRAHIQAVRMDAQQGVLQQNGIRLAIAGSPNAGKSSLLNALTGQATAIVTDVPGTTRDLIQERIQLDGMPLHVIDTAGLRETTDRVEAEGIRRARQAVETADVILFVSDVTRPETAPSAVLTAAEQAQWQSRLLWVANKSDLMPADSPSHGQEALCVSARTGAGMDELKARIRAWVGYQPQSADLFSARPRHVEALLRCDQCLAQAEESLRTHRASELAAEDLRLAQQALSEITGAFSADDLLGRIFSSFCIGK